MKQQEAIWLDYLLQLLNRKPQNNTLLESERGQEIVKVALEEEKKAFNWRRSDYDTFWIDMQLYTYYGFSDNQVRFVIRFQPGIWHHEAYGDERKAYAEMMRGMNKLRKIHFPEIYVPGESESEREEKFSKMDLNQYINRIENEIYGGLIPWGYEGNTLHDLTKGEEGSND